MNNTIDILLATYNGEKYLDQQLISIIEQQYTNWCLTVRDDGSTDDTLKILSKYLQLYPGKIQILDDSLCRLGPAQSFDRLMQSSTAEYVVFCDQDDIWFSDKLLLLQQHMVRMEDMNGHETPILVHSDLEVVDEQVNILANSFWLYQNINPSKMQSLERLLAQNCVTGCATMANRSLVDNAVPVPRGAIMHDWWLALLAVSLGKIESVNVSTVQYRQHASNDTGAKKWTMCFVFMAMLSRRGQYRESLEKTRTQAEALIESGKLDAGQSIIVSRYIGLFACGWLCRRLVIIRRGFYKYGVIRNIALMLWI